MSPGGATHMAFAVVHSRCMVGRQAVQLLGLSFPTMVRQCWLLSGLLRV